MKIISYILCIEIILKIFHHIYKEKKEEKLRGRLENDESYFRKDFLRC